MKTKEEIEREDAAAARGREARKHELALANANKRAQRSNRAVSKARAEADEAESHLRNLRGASVPPKRHN